MFKSIFIFEKIDKLVNVWKDFSDWWVAFLEKCINVYVSGKIDQNVEFFKTFILLQ